MRVIVLILFFYNFLFANLINFEKKLNSGELFETNSTKRVYLKAPSFKCSELKDKISCISEQVIVENIQKSKKRKSVNRVVIDKILTEFKPSILNFKSKKELSENLILLKIENFNSTDKESSDSINIKEVTFNNNFVNDIYPLPIIGKFGIEIRDITFDVKSTNIETNSSLNLIYNLSNFLIDDKEVIKDKLDYILKNSPKDRYIKIIKDKLPIDIDITLQNSSYDKNRVISNLKLLIDAKIFKLNTILNLTITSTDEFKNFAKNQKIKESDKLTNDLIVENLTFSIFDKEGLKEHSELLQKDKKYKESIEAVLSSLNSINSSLYQNSKEAINNIFLAKSSELVIFIDNKYQMGLSEFVPVGLGLFLQIAMSKDKRKVINSVESTLLKYFDIQIVNNQKDIVLKKYDTKDKPTLNFDNKSTFIPRVKKDTTPAIRFDYTLFRGLKTIKKSDKILKLIARDRNLTTTLDYFLNLKDTNGLLFFNLSNKAVDKIFTSLKNRNISIDINRLNKNYPLKIQKKSYKMGQYIEKNVFLIDGKIEHLKSSEYRVFTKELKKYEWYKLEFNEKN